jgi:leader peptidase (prepilin peptidase)/N-methyltransferase
MEIYYTVVFFIFGAIFGSFYNVVGYRLPKHESLIKPPSHCPKCNHKLKPIELIPIFSFLIQGGKCKNCQTKISGFYPIFEFSTGSLFALSYFLFGFSWNLVIALLFISMILIIIISDYLYLIIPDEVLVIFGVLLLISITINSGLEVGGLSLLEGAISFLIMFLLKKTGDFIFKKESMGGGDIKLMLIIGMVIGYKLAIINIFLASILGLPIAFIILLKNKNHVIPFGPFLGLASIIILLSQIEFMDIINYIS